MAALFLAFMGVLGVLFVIPADTPKWFVVGYFAFALVAYIGGLIFDQIKSEKIQKLEELVNNLEKEIKVVKNEDV